MERQGNKLYSHRYTRTYIMYLQTLHNVLLIIFSFVKMQKYSIRNIPKLFCDDLLESCSTEGNLKSKYFMLTSFPNNM